jgi:hypothetical protein
MKRKKMVKTKMENFMRNLTQVLVTRGKVPQLTSSTKETKEVMVHRNTKGRRMG